MVKTTSISDKKIKWALHTIAWIIVIVIPLYLINAFGGGNSPRVFQFYVHTFTAGIIFYAGYLWLVPKYFLKEKYTTYVIILIGLIIATHFLTEWINHTILFDPVEDEKFREAVQKVTGRKDGFRPPMKAFGLYNHIVTSILISGFAIGLGVMEKLKQNEKKQKELEKEKLNSELAFLKNQISPHFFFNTLNNIYSLIELDSAAARESVLKLSKMMRYLLYESERGHTLLSHEIDFMNNYIDLMRLRLSSKVELSVNFPRQINDREIEPLLFIPFIENAFKHGISYREKSFIRIDMQVNEGKIHFSISNSLGKSSSPDDGQHSGIGLENVRKRLLLLFPGKHQLEIKEEDLLFSVNLSIEA